MKPDNLNNLSQNPRGSVEGSTTENNSPSSDSDVEDFSCVASEQKRIVQGLRKTIRKNNTKINDLVAKLTIAEIHLASEKEKSIFKDELIKSLHMSIDLVNQSKDLSAKQLQAQVLELKNALELSKGHSIKVEDEKTSVPIDFKDQHKKEIEELNTKIAKLECTVQEKDAKIFELNEKVMKYADNLKEKEEQKITSDEANEPVYLNCTKVPLIKFVNVDNGKTFAAAFESIPSAGSDWMVIQRRVDGSVSFDRYRVCYEVGFGDLGTEFWIGLHRLHRVTTSRRYELYIELVDFDGAKAFARYDHFVVGSATENYKLKSVGEYSGNAGNALADCVNCSFRDKWWDNYICNLNGTYYKFKNIGTNCDLIFWGLWNMGQQHSLKSCKMLIRPKP
ncbi:fibrinogen-like protein 1 [Drosophila takahashii]|uniref:fibrinogen-like protein 1 n=1 Tax=Drosophila takahashii TaxID=29030 RepID=UPI0038990F90